MIKQDKQGVTLPFYAILTVALLELHLKQITTYENNDKQNTFDAKKSNIITGNSNQKKTILLKDNLFENIRKNLSKYLKIGINWITALKRLLPAVFDSNAIHILNIF